MNAKIALTETTNIKEPEPVTTATATKENAFAGASDALGAGIDALFADQGAQYSLIPLDMIQVKPKSANHSRTRKIPLKTWPRASRFEACYSLSCCALTLMAMN